MPLASNSGGDAGEMFVRKLQEEADQLLQEYIDTSDTTARAYRCRVALRPYCHQLSYMQPATGRGEGA